MPVGPGIRSFEPDALARSFGLAPAPRHSSATEPLGVGVRQVTSRTPFLASANMIRTDAALPSGISSPDWSPTRIVLRAIESLADSLWQFLTRGANTFNRRQFVSKK
jgi:hypothetical protein